MFVHSVLFWCKPGTEALQGEMIRYAQEEMPKVPTVKHVWAGKAVPATRDVVDSSYQVGLCVVFEDKAGHDVYQPHPIHLEFVRRFKDAWASVRVFDYE